MMQVQKFLREGGTLSALLNTRAIKANRSAVHPSLVLFLSYFPEWTEEFQAIQGGVAALVAELEREYERIKGAATQKDFALEAVNARCSAALFMLRAGKVGSIREFIEKKMRADHLLTAIGMTDSTYDVAE